MTGGLAALRLDSDAKLCEGDSEQAPGGPLPPQSAPTQSGPDSASPTAGCENVQYVKHDVGYCLAQRLSTAYFNIIHAVKK